MILTGLKKNSFHISPQNLLCWFFNVAQYSSSSRRSSSSSSNDSDDDNKDDDKSG